MDGYGMDDCSSNPYDVYNSIFSFFGALGARSTERLRRQVEFGGYIFFL